MAEAIEYGMFGVNEVTITSDVIPFGGVKESGVGHEGSKNGLDEYIEAEYICRGAILNCPLTCSDATTLALGDVVA